MKPETAPAEPLVSIRDLHVHYALRTNAVARLVGSSSGTVKAIDGVSVDLAPGEVLGVVGESGSGKSTLGRALLGLVKPTSGEILFRGQSIGGMNERELRPLRRKLQMVFQDPHASLNPSMTVGRAIADALRIHNIQKNNRDAAVAEALTLVGLAPPVRFAAKYPSELSGGQKQRAVIARAISLDPELLVADEPISMLDMSVRAKILGLLETLKRELSLTYVYITHDLASARFFCDRIAIMYLGKIVEIGPTVEIFDNPRHPYTQALLRAVPDPDPSRGMARDLPRGEIPDASAPPLGCSFHPRCPKAFAPCGWEARDIKMILEERWTAIPADQVDEERALVGEIPPSPDETVVLSPGRGSADRELALLEDERARKPDEPLWSGVSELSGASHGVRVQFMPRVEPQLRTVSDSPGEATVSVSCHLHHPPEGTTPPPH